LTSPPAGVEPGNFAARLEAGFLNSYQDFWQLVGDSLDNGFAQGKVLFWRKKVLEDGGGFPALGLELAEDVASTKLTKRMGYRIRLLAEPVFQPLGQRPFKKVWQRQVRWAKVRRFGFPLIYASEIYSFAALWWFVGIVAIATGALAWESFGLCFMLWYCAEYLLARVYHWPEGWRDVLAWIVRDMLLPLVWIAGYWGRGFEWQGHKMSFADIKKLQNTDA
jgi:ceramide glucosyltransferase